MRKCRHDLVHGELAELAWRDLRHSTLAEEVIVLDAEGRLESCGYHKNGHCHFEASAACAMARPDQGREEIAAVLRGDRDEAQFDYTSPDGDRIYLARVIPRSGGGAVISHVDITARRQLEERLRLAAALFDSSDEMHLVADADGTILLANSAAEGALGFAAGGLQGLRARDVVERAFLGLYGEQIWNQLQHEGHWNGEAWLQRKGGGTLPVWGSIRAVRDGRYRGRRFLIGATALDGGAESDSGNLARMALIDPLTGLRNRRAMLEHHLRFAVLRATRNKVSLGVMFIDLDGFKAVNDTRGHSAGDEVLRQVARRLQAKLRATDLCARIGGDEFTILIEDIETGDDLELVRQKVQRALSAPIDIDGHPQRVRASIGAAVFPEDGATAEALLQSADAAMYRRKRGRPDEARGQQDSQSG